jgi:hypothetical protein
MLERTQNHAEITHELFHRPVFYNMNCCNYDDLILNGISTNVWQAGTNVLAVRVYDDGETSFFDNRISLLPAITQTNQPLLVDAGPDQFINLQLQQTVYLAGTVMDDGLPPNGEITTTWSEVSGPTNNIMFTPINSSTLNTNFGVVLASAIFDTPGTYQLQLTASDSRLTATGLVTIIVDDGTIPPPTVSIITPTDFEACLAGTIPITATASASTGAIAQVDFYSTDTLIGRAITSPYEMTWTNVPIGSYELRAVATDTAGRLSAPAVSYITANYGVYAGPDQIITNITTDIQTNSIQLHGVIYDSSGNPPSEPFTNTWNVISHPPNSTVTFADTSLTNTMVIFSNNVCDIGTYILSLTVSSTNSGGPSSSSEVLITIISSDVVPYGASNYLYTYAATDIITDFFKTNYDDSGWTNGQAGFGNSNGCWLTPNTYWPGFDGQPSCPYFYVRRHFNVPVGTTNLSMGFALDNDAQIFLNGLLLAPTNTTFNGTNVLQNVTQTVYNGDYGFSTYYVDNFGQAPGVSLTDVFYNQTCCTYDNLILNRISTNVWHTGDNVLAVRVYDNGFASFFDSRISLQSTNSP